MEFKVGDQVVHPQHGLGQVTNFAIKQFVQGKKRPFYEIAFPGSTLWVPLALSTSGMRKLTGKSEIANCRRLLKARPAPLNDNPRLRQAELSDQLKEGTITANCEVVRDLTASGWHKPLSGTVSAFLNVAQDVLCQEWAAVEDVPLEEAAAEINALLEKGKQTNDNG